MKHILNTILILLCFNSNFDLFCHQQKVLFLTGAAGFIGSNFLEYMFNKYEDYIFIVLDTLTYAGDLDNIPTFIRNSKRFKFYQGSITDQKLVESLMANADFVIHFAAESHVSRSIVDDEIFFTTDVLGTRVMMASLIKFAKKIERYIHISTSEVYGTAEFEPMTEEHPLNPRSPYAAAKTGADRLVYSYCCTYNLPAVIIRPFNTYGPRQHIEKVIPRFISSFINNEPITIHGSGQQARDWMYVKDLCRALDRVLHTPNFDHIRNEIINIGSGKATSIVEIAEKLLNFFDIPDAESHIQHIKDRPGQVKMHICSNEKAHKLLNWQPRISIDQGLKKTIQWYWDHTEIWRKKENMKAVPITIDNMIEMQ